MTDDNMLPPNDDEIPATPDDFDDVEQPGAIQPPKDEQKPGNGHPPDDEGDNEDIKPRLERLGGEPAPDITPEEFARLQQAGQIHIDPRGRVRTTQRTETDAGISLRKRRAWYVTR
jgi:hypothetical protein